MLSNTGTTPRSAEGLLVSFLLCDLVKCVVLLIHSNVALTFSNSSHDDIHCYSSVKYDIWLDEKEEDGLALSVYFLQSAHCGHFMYI